MEVEDDDYDDENQEDASWRGVSQARKQMYQSADDCSLHIVGERKRERVCCLVVCVCGVYVKKSNDRV